MRSYKQLQRKLDWMSRGNWPPSGSRESRKPCAWVMRRGPTKPCDGSCRGGRQSISFRRRWQRQQEAVDVLKQSLDALRGKLEEPHSRAVKCSSRAWPMPRSKDSHRSRRGQGRRQTGTPAVQNRWAAVASLAARRA